MHNAERDLQELLSEDPAAAAARADSRLSLGGAPIVLYGAGTLGLTVLAMLRSAGLDAAAFADDTPSKQGTSIDGVPVMTAKNAAERFGKDALFVVTILNPQLRFLDARARLQSITDARVVSFPELGWALRVDRPEDVLRKREDILRAAAVFADEESRRQLAAHLRFRLHLDYEALPPNSKVDYFPPDVPLALRPGLVFVDCGAYDGDTVRRFLTVHEGSFGGVYAFEPDEGNCARLRDFVGSLPEHVASRIHVFCAATGDAAGKLRFNKTGNTSAALSESGTTEVDVVRVDEAVPRDAASYYVKYDVEGAEWEALRGTEGLLQTGRAALAVSVYHRMDDLWQLPLHLHSLGLGYQLYLRTQGEDGTDIICYAIPA